MDLWNWMGSPFGGNIAEWVGGVGTTGALILALILLRRDRREAQLTQARKVIATLRIDDKGVRASVRNLSDYPVSDIHFILRSYHRSELFFLAGGWKHFWKPARYFDRRAIDTRGRDLAPGEQAEVRIAGFPSTERQFHAGIMTFIDEQRRFHAKRTFSNRLYTDWQWFWEQLRILRMENFSRGYRWPRRTLEILRWFFH